MEGDEKPYNGRVKHHSQEGPRMEEEKPSRSGGTQAGGERIIRIETQLSYMQQQQQRFEVQHEKIMDALEALTRRSDVHENTGVAIKESLVAHEKELEAVQTSQVDMGKILVIHSAQLSRVDMAIKYVAAPVVTLIIGYFFALFTHLPK